MRFITVYTPVQNRLSMFLENCKDKVRSRRLNLSNKHELGIIQSINIVGLLIVIFSLACAENQNLKPQIIGLEDQRLEVNRNHQFEVSSFDPDEDFITYSFDLSPMPPTQTMGQGGIPTLQKVSEYKAIFSWTPGVADVGQYFLTVRVTDQDGAVGEETINLLVVDSGVVDGQGIRFVKPEGDATFLDLSQETCLEEDVLLAAEALEPNELQVSVIQPSTAILEPTGPKRFVLRWCPTPEEYNTQTNFLFIMRVTNTRGLPTVEKRYQVRIQTPPNQGDCPGNPPMIEHRSLTDQRGIGFYEIRARISDDLGIKSNPTLRYQGLPLNSSQTELSENGWSATNLRLSIGNEWVGLIPPVQNSEGASVFYQLIVSDNDDPNGGNCDHTIRSEVYSFNAFWDESIPYNAPRCSPCIVDLQCGQPGDLCIPMENGEGRCGQSCSSTDCAVDEQCLTVTSIEGVASNQCISVNACGISCEADQIDALTPNQERQTATPWLTSNVDALSICEGDRDVFSIPVERGSRLSAELMFDHIQGDLDLEVALVGSSERIFKSERGDRSLEEVQIDCAPEAATAFVTIYGYEGAQNRYQLMVSTGPGNCEVSCDPDRYDTPNEPRLTGDISQAPQLSLGDQLNDLKICPDDQDLFSIPLVAGEQLEIRLEYQHQRGGLMLELYNPQLVLVNQVMGSGRDIELMTVNAMLTGSYILIVKGRDSFVQNDYQLALNVSEARCTQSRECPSNEYCNIGGQCVTDTCTGTCEAGAVCKSVIAGRNPNSFGGHCLMQCDNNTQCRVGYECKKFDDFQGYCARVGPSLFTEGCSNFTDCAGNMICFEEAGGYCSPGGCVGEVLCPENSMCDTEGIPICRR